MILTILSTGDGEERLYDSYFHIRCVLKYFLHFLVKIKLLIQIHCVVAIASFMREFWVQSNLDTCSFLIVSYGGYEVYMHRSS